MGSMKSSSSKAGICALVALVIGPSRSGHALAQDPPVDPSTLKQELPRIPPREPKDALSTFRVKEGFSLELVASEPDVVDPVAMAIDEDGRMFVVEMRDYPFERGKGQNPEQDARAHPGRVRLLEDRDDD